METTSSQSTDPNGGPKEPETLGTRTEIEVVDACKRTIKAAIPAERVREHLDGSYRELAKSVQLPGFRPGRVPRRLLEARFHEEIEKELKESLVGRSFGEVVDEKGLKVIGAPRFDNIRVEEDADLTYEVEVEVRPEFELPAYKGIEVAREPVRVTDEEVDAQIESIRKEHAKPVPIDPSEASPDDLFQGTYQLFRDDVRVKAASEVRFVPARKLLGPFPVEDLPERMKAWDAAGGDPLNVDVTVPQDFGDEVLRGLPARLEFALSDVQRNEVPPLDDAFARELGKESLAELREEVRKSLEFRAVRKEELVMEEKIVEKIAAATTVELPKDVLEGQKRRRRARREYELLVEQGLSPDRVKEEIEKEDEAADDELRSGLKGFFILERIAEEEKIFATEGEVEDRLALMAAYSGMSLDRLRAEMSATNRIDDFRVQLRHEKVRKFLRKKARVVGGEAQPEEAQPEEAQPEEAQPEEAQPEEAQPEEPRAEESRAEGAQPEDGEPGGTPPAADGPAGEPAGASDGETTGGETSGGGQRD